MELALLLLRGSALGLEPAGGGSQPPIPPLHFPDVSTVRGRKECLVCADVSSLPGMLLCCHGSVESRTLRCSLSEPAGSEADLGPSGTKPAHFCVSCENRPALTPALILSISCWALTHNISVRGGLNGSFRECLETTTDPGGPPGSHL